MIEKLIISNYALIEHTELKLGKGFTTITGETGAGKSIMLEALGLVLGARANFSSIRKGTEKCTVEAWFSYNKTKIDPVLEREGLDKMTDLIIRRELTTSGRSRAFLNDSPVSVAVIKEVAAFLIDIHGQQENISLHLASYQTRQLDLFAHNLDLRDSYRKKFQRFKSSQKELEQIREQATQVRKDEDYFRFQLDELNEVDLKEEVFSALDSELGELEHAEDIQRALTVAVSALNGEEAGALSALRIASNELKAVAKFSKDLNDLFERLNSTLIEIEDLEAECERREGGVEFNSNRLEEVRDLLDVYNKLFHKHGVQNIGELTEVKKDYESKVNGIDDFEDQILQLEKQVQKALTEATKDAKQLTIRRKSSQTTFEKKLLEQIHQLGMPKAHFAIDIKTLSELTVNGDSEVSMRFNANSKDDLAPINEVASGGEVSRLMLGLKSILSEADEIPTMIFDEIDTGVSGEVAKRIGALMKSIGSKTQIIAVTHLPGVAAKGQHHFKIVKSEKQGKVVSTLVELDKAKRVEELAAMFTGDHLTEASLESARLLLEDV